MSLRSVRVSATAVAFARGFAGLLLLLTAACATAPDQTTDPEGFAEFQARNDPLEPLNRGVFAFNDVIDLFLLRPASGFYRLLVPPPIQTGVNNVLRNFNSPVVLANDLLQGEFERAGKTVARFVVNTIGGVGGLYDLATDLGIDYHSEDFGQTLAVWGAPEGPYLVLPLLGPSSPRDAVGRAVDSFVFDPFSWWVRANPDERQKWAFARIGATVINARSRNHDELEDIRANSLDPYATFRSLYQQFRRGEINQGRGGSGAADGALADDIYLDGPPP
jgi:phospholipid-binding lipoprotein MlaA